MGSSNRSNTRSSVDSNSDRPKSQAGETAESAKSGHSGISKLLSGSRRRRKKKDKLKAGDESSTMLLSFDNERGLQPSRSNESRDGHSIASSSVDNNQSRTENQAGNFLTDDSEPDPSPPLATRDTNAGFYTTSTPLIKTTPVEENDTDGAHADAEFAVSGHSAVASDVNRDFSRTSAHPGFGLDAPENRDTRERSPSPRRRLNDAFSPNSGKGRANDSPAASKTGLGMFGNGSKSSLSARRAYTVAESAPAVPPPIRTDLTQEKPREIDEDSPPKTPPLTALPLTTVTPPSPAQHKLSYAGEMQDSPESIKPPDLVAPGIVVSHSGNMISHRRVRSASAASHKPSKLSNSISALTPTAEESKTPGSRTASTSQQGGFFSSVFSAAQSAATTISSSLNSQSRSRNASHSVPAKSENVAPENGADQPDETSSENNGGEKKLSALDTLGTGNLNFSDLDMDMPAGGVISTTEGVVITKPDVAVEKRRNTAAHQRDEESARLEDRRAAQAVSMAYGRQTEGLGSAAAEDGIELHTSVSRDGTDQRTPNGSVVDGESGGLVKRSGSVRSRLARRRHRGSSAATASTVGAIGAGAIAMGIATANTSMPRLTGFAVASKKRNRDFHQLFRSVPEDDYLIEDYSCALQREIILAGRIYISEGHICFSSNILGWVTTLVISFDEIVAIEKETTAMVFPNAIAIQTLHARHTFRSLLSRESTYDLMVNIWKINHPALKSSVNGTRIENGTGDKTEKADESEGESGDSDEDEIYDEDEEGNNADGFFEVGEGSVHGSDQSISTRGVSLTSANGTTPALAPNLNGDAKGADKAAGTGEADGSFPGPPTHAPTEYNDPAGRYDKIVKDDVIPAPLGKVYTLIFGPESGSFIPKFLVDNQKSAELQFESDKKGLTNESKTRQYSYIKPLPGAIGPKQTKCISTENLDFLDLEKAVLVTLSTQTPDVPSGNVFATKTKYLLTWAPGNQTRFLMSCAIEWTGKSWLKGPIEKGAIDGQTTFGNELIKALKAAAVPRGRALKSGKGKGRRKKGEVAIQEAAAASAAAAAAASAEKASSWGPLEPLHALLGPIFDTLKPLLSGNAALLIIGALLFMYFFRGPSPSPMLSDDVGCPSWTAPQRLAAYEEMWRREESELWNWLEDRVGMDRMSFPTIHRSMDSQSTRNQIRRKLQGEREVAARLNEDKMSDREMVHAIRTTRERLDLLEDVLSKRSSEPKVQGEKVNDDTVPGEFLKSD